MPSQIFNELSVELKQESEDYITSPVSSAIHFFNFPSNEMTEIASTSTNKYEVALPRNQVRVRSTYSATLRKFLTDSIEPFLVKVMSYLSYVKRV